MKRLMLALATMLATACSTVQSPKLVLPAQEIEQHREYVAFEGPPRPLARTASLSREVVREATDLIFEDDFESGDLSAWSAVSPLPPTNPGFPQDEFFLSVSAYGRLTVGAQSASEFRRLTRRDYDAYQQYGYNGEEIWLNALFPEEYWVMNEDGSVNEPMYDRFLVALGLAEQRGLYLSVRVHCGDMPISALRSFWPEFLSRLEGRNVLADLCNEATPHKQSALNLARLARDVRRAAPLMPITISGWRDFLPDIQIAYTLITNASDPPYAIDYLSSHGPRGRDWGEEEQAFTEEMVAFGQGIWVQYNHEPHRRGYPFSSYEWPPEGRLLRGRHGSCLGWCGRMVLPQRSERMGWESVRRPGVVRHEPRRRRVRGYTRPRGDRDFPRLAIDGPGGTGRIGDVVFVYRNLHKGCWSIRSVKRRRVFARDDVVEIEDAVLKVSEAGRQRVLDTQRKNVHAGVQGVLKAVGHDPSIEGSTEITYDPYRFPCFVISASHEPVTAAERVVLSHGKVYAWGLTKGL